MFIKLIGLSFIFLLTFLFFPSLVFAINLSISNPQITNDEVIVQVDITGLSTKNYLQGMFTQSTATPSYFGYTQNNYGDWYKYNGSYTKEEIQATFFSFTPEGASWSGQLKIKNDLADPDFKGPGDYVLRVRRYTGNSDIYGGEPVSNDLVVSLSSILPTVAPTPTPTSTPAPTSTPTPTPTPVPTKIPTPTLIAKVKTTPKPIVESQNSESKVLAAREELKPTVTPTTKPDGGNQKSFPLVAGVLMVAGVVFVGLASFPFIKMRLKGYNEKHGPGKVEQ